MILKSGKTILKKDCIAAGALKIVSSLGYPGPRLIGLHGSLGPPESTSQTASRSVQRFHGYVRQTHTDHGTSVTIGRIFAALCACDAA